VVAGAAASFVLMLRVGHANPSRFLIALFAIWVLSPFVALVLADIVSKRWSMLTRATLYWLMLVLALGSPAIYARVALGPPRPQPASFFLLVPFGSWLLMAIVLPIAGRISGRLSRDRKS
jgi:hypothetical protein